LLRRVKSTIPRPAAVPDRLVLRGREGADVNGARMGLGAVAEQRSEWVGSVARAEVVDDERGRTGWPAALDGPRPTQLVVEHAAGGGGRPADLWKQMNHNRAVGVRWATRMLLAKPGTSDLRAPEVESAFWVAFDWAPSRTPTPPA